MLPFSYEDRAPQTSMGGGFGATNEEPVVIRSLVKPFNKGLAIASAGEVAFFSLLPKTNESLVVVDHAYPSLRAFCIKALLLATIGPARTRQLLIAEKSKGWNEAIDKIVHHLPESLRGSVTHKMTEEAQNIRREWFYTDLFNLGKATKNLHKIKMVHGDLLDTHDRAPYDFLYLSNALEHTKRGGGPPVVKLLTKLLHKGSPVLWTTQKYGSLSGNSNTDALSLWKEEKNIEAYRTSWVYRLSTT